MTFKIRRKVLALSLSVALASSAIMSSGVVSAQAITVSQQDLVTVTLDGVVQEYPQSALTKDGRTLVPLRGIFESLGAKVTWNNETQVARGTKGNTEVLVQIGNKTAYVNGKAVELDVPAQIINGSTMVPLRFVSESLGAKVEWNNDTRTASITSDGSAPVVEQVKPGQENAKVVYGENFWKYDTKIEVKYGKHDYGVQNQKQYDEAMKIVNDSLKNLDLYKVGGERFNQAYMNYLNGDRASNYSDRKSDEFKGLTLAEGELSSLVKAGVSKSTIIEAVKIQTLANSYINKAKSLSGNSAKLSVYDVFVNKEDNCNSTAHTYSAFFDAMGYNTAVVASSSHADALVELDGSWFKVVGLEKVDFSPSTLTFGSGSSGSLWLMATPTK